MLEKKRLKRNYIDVQTLFRDTNNKSPNILDIKFVPEVFTAGKNIFKLKPNNKIISSNFPIDIEILDKNGEPIYHEILKSKEKTDLINVSVYVYETTPAGQCTITILSTVTTDRTGRRLTRENIKKHNYKYTHTLSVDPKKQNESEIIYSKEPEISIKEKSFSVIEEINAPNKLTTTSGFGNYELREDGTPRLTARNNLFDEDFIDGTIYFGSLSSDYRPSVAIRPFEYTSSIKSVVSPRQVNLKDAVYITGSDGVFRTVSSVTNQPYTIKYYKKPTIRNITQNIKTYAQIDISGLDPEVGNTSRIKVFAKSAVKPNQSYELIYDDVVLKNNRLVDTGSKFIEYPIGIFQKNVTVKSAGTQVTYDLDTSSSYWNAISVNGAPTDIVNIRFVDRRSCSDLREPD